jgi:hypothetical protein
VEETCESCGSATAQGQHYCLRCGARVRSRRGPLRRYGWVWPALAALAIAAAGAAVAIVATERTGAASVRTIVALSPLRSPPAAKPARRARGAPSKEKPARKNQRREALTTWPRRSGYTIVLASVPVRDGAGAARAIAKQALRRRLPQVGVLVSASFSGLQPGYYVVFSGVYRSVEEAQGRLRAAHARYPGAFAREITR